MGPKASCFELKNYAPGRGRGQRRGISLLEVLISMFILLFGLMGVASMFPAGQWHVSKANRYDRAAAVGEAAFNDLQVRGMLLQQAYPSPPTPPYVVDPAGSSVWTMMLNRNPPPDIATQKPAVFSSRDDLSVEFPSDADKPSFLFPSTVQRQYEGHFSWLYMVTRNPGSPTTQPMCDVSVVVFYKRDVLNPNGETNISLTPATDMSESLGGGEITFAATSNTTPEQVRPGNWLMLTGSLPLTGELWIGWYRITASDATTSPYAISCVGPDWTALTELSDVNMTLFDSAVAVYQKTMNLEQSSPWSFVQ